MHNPSNQSLVAVGTSRTQLGELQKALGLDQLALANGGRTVEVFQTGRAYQSGRVDADTQELRGIREALGIKSQLAVPLVMNGVRRGVVQVDSQRPDTFSAEDAAFLEAVAHWVGMVIQRAELFELQTQQAAADARRLVAEELVTVLAHDLRNYLTPLLGRAQILHARAVRENRDRDVQDTSVLEQGIERIQRLIADLLDIGRLEQGVFTVVPQLVNLPDLARDVAAELGTPQFSVQVHAPDELVAIVDPDRIRQAIENLLPNARHHAPGSPVALLLGSEQRDSVPWAIVSVVDQGPGIAPDMVPQLMERFVRGRQSGGLGIGLYLARGIAEAHGGTLEVTSTLGQGTAVRLLVPIVSG